MAKKESERNEARNWTIIGYPGDSLPDDYIYKLDDLHVPWCQGPVHRPSEGSDGLELKPHIHFVFSFKGNKSFNQMCRFSELLHAPIPKPVADLRGMVRYLVHLDHPDREQFDGGFSRIDFHGGFDMDNERFLSNYELDDTVWEIVDFCDSNQITEFGQLVRYVRQNGMIDWQHLICRRYTMFLSTVLRSNHFSDREVVKDAQFQELLGSLSALSKKACDR